MSLAVTGKMKQSIGVCIVYSKLHAYVVGTMVKHFPGPHDQDHDTRIEEKKLPNMHTLSEKTALCLEMVCVCVCLSIFVFISSQSAFFNIELIHQLACLFSLSLLISLETRETNQDI